MKKNENISDLFDPLTIGQMKIPNRFVRSATGENRGKDGRVTDSLVDVYRELAKGEIGLIVTGVLYPKKSGKIFQNMIGVDADNTVPGLKRIAEAVHANGGKIAAQIGHGGGHCLPEWTGFQAEGPSTMINPHSGLEARGLSGDEVRELVDLFVQAARRTVEAGFDAVQIHAAHSHLISQFLSPVTNRRDDEWGGSAEKRSRFLMEIYQGIRKTTGPSFPILVKLGLEDTHPEGKPLVEGIATARTLATEGVDALEVSEGFESEPGHHIRADTQHPCYLEQCRQVRQEIDIPIILVGGMRSLQDMKSVLENDIADAVSLSRPFIMDPHLVLAFRQGLTMESGCISCNGCVEAGIMGEPCECTIL